MKIFCPECNSHEFVPFNGEYLCCNCSRVFGPKCPECGTEMDPHGRVWICPSCQKEIEFSEIDLPQVDSKTYLRAFHNVKSSRSKSKTTNENGQSFFGFLWDTLCDNFTSMLNSSKK